MKNQTTAYRERFAGDIHVSLKTAAQMFAAYPASAAAFMRLLKSVKQAESRRAALARQGVEIPPLLIVSTTAACNLACAGCYACAREEKPGPELGAARISQLLDEASGLGVSVVMLAGGEPLLSQGWLDALGRHSDMAGIVFTNGTLFDERQCQWFAGHRHMIPTFSLEGDRRQTDERRGSGVYAKVTYAMESLGAKGVPFGVSLTVTSGNINSILNDALVATYFEKGCRLFVFVEYVPVAAGSEPLVLSKAEKKQLNSFALAMADKYPALFIPFPGDEEPFGGCLAAGRGFVHISANGDVEPCPFAPFSVANPGQRSLREALQSAFLARVRQEHHLLKEGDGGCALWHNREWLEQLILGLFMRHL